MAMDFIAVTHKVKPQIGRNVICYCPDWCNSGYIVAQWDGEEFHYDEDNNGDFNKYVTSWKIFKEAD